MLAPWKKSYDDQPRPYLKKQRHLFANKGLWFFSNSHVWMWELDYKERSAWKNWSFWTVVLKKTLASPLDCKEIHPVHPKGNQSWIFIGRTDDEAEAIILWPPDAKNWLIGKDPDAWKNWKQEEKVGVVTEDEMVGWYHWLNGCKSEKALEISDGQENLVCCSPKWKWKSLSCARLSVTPWTIQSMEFSRPEYWSG